jgi:hypothetical protein
LRQPKRTEYPLLQTELDAFTVKVAELNAKNVSIRYEEDAQAEVEGFTDIPLEKITVQDIKHCDCWMYQTCDYLDEEPLFKMVKEATEWAKVVTPYSKEEYSEAEWG